jgi:hypothetical protein
MEQEVKEGKVVKMELTPEQEAKRKKAEELEQEKLRKIAEAERIKNINLYKKGLRDDLEVLRLEHEFMKMRVELYQYEKMWEGIQGKEAEMAAQRKEAEEKAAAATKAKETSSKKILVPSKELVGTDGEPLKKE